MKKLFLSVALATFAAGSALAQDAMVTETGGGIKPTAGEFTLEANVNLLNSDVRLSNSLNQIRGRYFMSDDFALRLGANLSLDSRTQNPDDDTEIKYSHFAISLMPGIEKHFTGTDRLSPYIGAELGIGISSRSQEVTADGNKTEIKGGWDTGERGNFQFGLNGIAGFDFYVARHLYVGYELGFGFNLRSDSAVEVNNIETDGKNSSFSIGPNVRNGIRVGFVF